MLIKNATELTEQIGNNQILFQRAAARYSIPIEHHEDFQSFLVCEALCPKFLASVDFPTLVETVVWRLANQKALNWFRKIRKRMVDEQSNSECIEQLSQAESHVRKIQLQEFFEVALGHLADISREIVVCRMEGRDYADIARRIGQSEAATRKTYSRAILKLRLIRDKLMEDTPNL